MFTLQIFQLLQESKQTDIKVGSRYSKLVHCTVYTYTNADNQELKEEIACKIKKK